MGRGGGTVCFDFLVKLVVFGILEYYWSKSIRNEFRHLISFGVGVVFLGDILHMEWGGTIFVDIMLSGI